MANWVAIRTFSNNNDAFLAQSYLESEGIRVKLYGERINQIHPISSGGVRLMVKSNDYMQAHFLLSKAGYIDADHSDNNKFWIKFERISSKIPLLNKVNVLIRLLIIAAILSALFIVPMFWISFQ